MPDLTLVGLILIGARAPQHWWLLSAMAIVGSLGWAVRFPLPLMLSYLVMGGAGPILARQVDATDLRIEWLAVASATLALTLGSLWVEDLWSARLLVLASVRVTVTCAAVPLVRQAAIRAMGSV